MFTILVAAVLTAPFQLALVRALGYWGGSLIGSVLAEGGLRLSAAESPDPRSRRSSAPGETARIIRARHAATDRLATYPAQHLMPTRLGNALRAAEERAGQRYDADTVAAWPRLYPYLSSRLADTLAGLRNQLDLSARFCVGLLLITYANHAPHGDH